MCISKIKIMEKCLNCHFLAKDYMNHSSCVHQFSLREKERNYFKKNNLDEINKLCDMFSLNCHMGVWDFGAGTRKKDLYNIVARVNRKNKCFYIPFEDGMLFKGAIEVQKRQNEIDQLKKTNRFSVIGLFLVGAGLVFNSKLFDIIIKCFEKS